VPGRRIAVFLLIFAIFQACARRPQPAGIARLAVLPFDDLTSDARLGRACAAVIAYDLAGASNLAVQPIGSRSDAYATHASQILDAYVTQQQDRLEIHATLESLDARTATATYLLGGPVSDGLIPLLNQLSQKLAGNARQFSTANQEAFRLYGEALGAKDTESASQVYEAATRLDARFSSAYLGWAEALFTANDRAGALKVLTAGKSQNPDAIDQAEMDYLVASGAGDLNGREKALEALTRLTPANSKPFNELAQQQFASRKFQDSVRSFEAAARLSPEDPTIWNELGYAQAELGDLKHARELLERYQALAPDTVNPLDSLGEVSFFLGDFGGAAKYFEQARQKNPAVGGIELLKSAQAHLFAGDLKSADALFGQAAGLSALQRAQWEFVTGRRKEALARITDLAANLEGDARTLTACQLALWKLQTGDSKSAAELAMRTASEVQSTQARTLAATCLAIAARTPPPSKTAAAYALIFARNFSAATPLLESIYRETNPSVDSQIRTMLAWAYIETGRIADARPLLRLIPIPLVNGSDPLFASLLFPRFLYLRSVILEKDGKQDEAKRWRALYLKYAGDVPDIFDSNTQHPTALRN